MTNQPTLADDMRTLLEMWKCMESIVNAIYPFASESERAKLVSDAMDAKMNLGASK